MPVDNDQCIVAPLHILRNHIGHVIGHALQVRLDQPGQERQGDTDDEGGLTAQANRLPAPAHPEFAKTIAGGDTL